MNWHETLLSMTRFCLLTQITVLQGTAHKYITLFVPLLSLKKRCKVAKPKAIWQGQGYFPPQIEVYSADVCISQLD